MKGLWQDVRYGLRVLGKTPGFTAAAVLILALGIGAITTIFSVLDALLFKPLPYRDADRIVFVFEGRERVGNWGGVSAADFEDWKNQNQVFAEMAMLAPDSINVSGESEPERVGAVRVSSGLIQLLGITPVLGRAFPDEEFLPGKGREVLLSQGIWKRRFGARTDVVGESLAVDGQPHRIAGILPAGLKLAMLTGSEPDVLLPFAPGASEGRSARRYGVLARLRPGVTLERARADMTLIARRLGQQHPETNGAWTVWVDTLRGQVDPVAYVLLATLICAVLGIACTNVTNLLLARAAGRQKEISIRSSLGATRGRILRQLLTESMLLSFFGCCVGILISLWACSAIRVATAGTNAGILDVSVDRGVLGACLVLFFVTVMAVGLLPALQGSRGDLNQPLKESGSGTQGSPSRRRIRNTLVTAEIAVSLLLLTGAGLVIKSWYSMWQVDLGFKPQGIMTMRVSLSKSEYPEPAKQAAFFRQVLGRLENRPGLKSAALTTALPTMAPAAPFLIAGRPRAAQGEEPVARISAVSPKYFSTMSIPLNSGRVFDEGDTENGPKVAVVNEAMARKYWPGEDPRGAQVEVSGALRMITGVVGDVKAVPLSIRPFPEIYLPYPQAPGGQMSLVVRAASDSPLSVAASVKEEIQRVNPNQPASGIRSMEEALSSNMGVIQLGTSLLAVLAAGALVLAGVGLYGVLSYVVAQRTGEIGIRMALGAARGDVLGMVLRQGALLIVCGVAPGLLGSLALGRVLSNRVHGVSAIEPLVLSGVVLILAAVSFLACYVPARRATRVDPIRALRG